MKRCCRHPTVGDTINTINKYIEKQMFAPDDDPSTEISVRNTRVCSNIRLSNQKIGHFHECWFCVLRYQSARVFHLNLFSIVASTSANVIGIFGQRTDNTGVSRIKFDFKNPRDSISILLTDDDTEPLGRLLLRFFNKRKLNGTGCRKLFDINFYCALVLDLGLAG